MKSICTNVAGGLVLALAMASPALAERGEASYYAPPSFGDLDQDRNGFLDAGEVGGRTPLYGQWERFDTDRDGLIERSEFAAFEVDEAAMPKAPLDSGPGAPMAKPGATQTQ
jgi:hypothetical protein